MANFANNGKLKLLIIVGTRPEMVRRWLVDETAKADKNPLYEKSKFNFVIKREKRDACISISEREQSHRR